MTDNHVLPLHPSNHEAEETPPRQSALSEQDRKRKAMLEHKIADLQTSIDAMASEKTELEAKLKSADAAATVRDHIKLLHEYNEIKDVGLGLLGMIAEQRGARMKEVMEEFGLGDKD